ncbi:MAG: Xaa-Pro peptidase family protein, partial [bacterium]|nr:Xaa-Pro peptidase family protein [bacterium]
GNAKPLPKNMRDKAYNQRIIKLRQSLLKRKLLGMVITNPVNRNYLSGFTGTEAVLVIGLNRAYFITDFRYTEQAKKEGAGFTIVEKKPAETALETCARIIQQHKWLKVGFEAEHLSYAQHHKLKKYLKHVKLVPTEKLVESLREIKDKSEISLIKKATDIAEKAFAKCLRAIRIEKTEKEIADLFECEAKRLGADKIGFEIIIASGTRGSLPHGVASYKKLKKGEFITIDFGIIYQGYCSDCTRTFILGQPTDKQKKIYNLVLQAQQTAVASVRAGTLGKELDKIARSIIEKAGYGKYFGHGLGHGLGREVHESPRISSQSKMKLSPGMVITIEPGIYIPNWGGVRIEDLVLVTDNGYKLFTSFPKELICLPLK